MAKNTKPAIRFKGFTDDWEQRKLGEVGKARSGVGFPDAEQGGSVGVPFFKVSDMNLDGNENEMIIANNYVTVAQILTHRWSPIEELPAIFFAKVGAAVMLNRKRLCRFPFLLDNNTMAYSIPSINWNADFAKALFETVDLTSLVQIGALPSYNASDVEDITICLPNLSEQMKVGAYFKQIDNLITLHQRKYDSLVNVKKAMLEKMFPKNGETVPEIRFKGFTDAWEQRKLGEICEKITMKNTNMDVTETFTNSAEFGIISQRDFFDHDIAKQDKIDGYYIVHPEDFVYNPRISVTAPVGPINRNKLGRCGVMSPLYSVFRPNGMDNTFLEQFFKSSYWHSFMRLNGDSGARSDRFSIKDSVFFDMPIPCPNLQEQESVGRFLYSIDNLITLHQRKLEKLKNIKKSCLEKMFV